MNYLINVLVIQLSIVLFILPFYLWYRLSYYKNKEISVSLNQHLEYFFSSKQANYLVFFWSFGEAVAWFVIPEFLLLLIVFMRIRNRVQLLMFDIYGTIAGVIVALLINLPNGKLLKLPYVQENMLQQVQAWYSSSGIFGLIHQPFSGVPFKVFNHLAIDYHLNIFLYITFAVIVRIGRYGIFYLIFQGVYSVLHKFVYKNYVRLFVIATLIFAVLLYKVYLSFGAGYVLKP